MQAEIVAIGTELLLGEIVDTNSAHIARTLRDVGLDIYYMTTVGDNEQRVADALRIALQRADVVICTGGLGPTVDDVTRQAIASGTGHPLVFKQELLDQIAERFKKFGSKMAENNRQQAYVPQGALAIENPVGTAPIFIIDGVKGMQGDKIVTVLPGVPREMKHLLETEIVPWLRQRLNLKATIKARTLRTAGIGESSIDDEIADLMRLSNPTVGLAAHPGQTDIRITAKADSEDEASALIEPIEAELRKRLGTFIFGTEKDILEEVLVEACSNADVSLAVCEAATDKTLDTRLLAAADGTTVYAGAQVYDDDAALAKGLGIDGSLPVSQMAEAAAIACRDRYKTTMGLAIVVRPMNNESGNEERFGGTAIANATADGVRSHYYAFDKSRSDLPIWASTHALAMARNIIMKGNS